MKNLILTAIVAVTLAGSTANAQLLPPGFPIPQEHPRDDRDVIVDRDGRVISHRKNLPPGQAKKIYGGKSAKDYAPGQRKKVNRDYSWPGNEDRRVRRDDDWYETDESGYKKSKKHKGNGKHKNK